MIDYADDSDNEQTSTQLHTPQQPNQQPTQQEPPAQTITPPGMFSIHSIAIIS
jgi:hypothetical protein